MTGGGGRDDRGGRRRDDAAARRDDRDAAERPRHRRLFVGARVSVATANALAGAAETLARRARDARIDVRWVAPINYHVTLRFLGATRDETIGAVRDALAAAAAGTPRIAFRTARVGAFPALPRARVVWAGVEDRGGQLAPLATRIEDACARLGYRPEARPFHAHVTLGRVKELGSLQEVVLPLSEQMFGDTEIEAITLFESETKSAGPVYRELHRIAFKSVDPGPETASERQSPALGLGDASDDTDDGWPRGHVPNTDV